MQDKKTFITIVVLLVLMVPMTIYGTVKHFQNNGNTSSKKSDTKLVDDNPNKDLIYNNKVYLYDNNSLIGVYNCNNCSKLKTTIDDTNYHTNYYKYGNYEINPVLPSKYALFSEGDKANLYDTKNSKVFVTYEAIKNYNVKNNINVYIIKNNGKWGAFIFEEFPFVTRATLQYDYIALPTHFENNDVLDATKLIVKNGNKWQVIENDKVLYENNTEIVDFNDNFYITYDGSYHIFDNLNNEMLSSMTKNKVFATGNYLAVVINNSNVLLYKGKELSIVKTETISSYTDLYMKVNNKNIDIYDKENKVKSIEIS